MLQILHANTLFGTVCQQMKIWPLSRCGLGHVTHFEILGPLYIFGTVEDRNFVFGALIEYNMF